MRWSISKLDQAAGNSWLTLGIEKCLGHCEALAWWETEIVSLLGKRHYSYDFRIIHFVDEKGLEAKVPKSYWTKELKGSHEYIYNGQQVQLPSDFPHQNFAKSLK